MMLSEYENNVILPKENRIDTFTQFEALEKIYMDDNCCLSKENLYKLASLINLANAASCCRNEATKRMYLDKAVDVTLSLQSDLLFGFDFQ